MDVKEGFYSASALLTGWAGQVTDRILTWYGTPVYPACNKSLYWLSYTDM